MFQTITEECQGILDNIDGVTTVHGRFYELTSNYHKLMGNHAQYYQEALRFLGCTELKVAVHVLRCVIYRSLGSSIVASADDLQILGHEG